VLDFVENEEKGAFLSLVVPLNLFKALLEHSIGAQVFAFNTCIKYSRVHPAYNQKFYTTRNTSRVRNIMWCKCRAFGELPSSECKWLTECDREPSLSVLKRSHVSDIFQERNEQVMTGCDRDAGGAGGGVVSLRGGGLGVGRQGTGLYLHRVG